MKTGRIELDFDEIEIQTWIISSNSNPVQI